MPQLNKPLGRPPGKPLKKPLGKPLGKPLSKPLNKPLSKPLGKPLVSSPAISADTPGAAPGAPSGGAGAAPSIKGPQLKPGLGKKPLGKSLGKRPPASSLSAPKPAGKGGSPKSRTGKLSQTIVGGPGVLAGATFRVFDKGKWRRKEFAASKSVIKIGSETQESEIVVSGEGVDKAQAIVRRIGGHWFVMERGNEYLMKVNGFPEVQTVLSSQDTCVVEIGGSPIVLLFGGGEGKEKRKDFDDYFSLATMSGGAIRFDAKKLCLIGTDDACDFQVIEDTGAPPFAACIGDRDGRLYVTPISGKVEVAGRTIHEPTPLNSKTPLFVGGADLLFEPGTREGAGTGDLEIPEVGQRKFVFLQMLDESSDGATPMNVRLPRAGKAAILGRSSEADIVLPGKSVSKEHIHVIMYPKSVLVTDMDSSNGTYVNDEKVRKRLMRAGDILSVGEYHFFLCFAD